MALRILMVFGVLKKMAGVFRLKQQPVLTALRQLRGLRYNITCLDRFSTSPRGDLGVLVSEPDASNEDEELTMVLRKIPMPNQWQWPRRCSLLCGTSDAHAQSNTILLGPMTVPLPSNTTFLLPPPPAGAPPLRIVHGNAAANFPGVQTFTLTGAGSAALPGGLGIDHPSTTSFVPSGNGPLPGNSTFVVLAMTHGRNCCQATSLSWCPALIQPCFRAAVDSGYRRIRG